MIKSEDRQISDPNANKHDNKGINISQLSFDPLTVSAQGPVGQPSHIKISVLERKRDNIQFIYNCYQQHHNYYHQHINLLSHVQSSIEKNIRETRAFCLQTYQYFERIRNSYWILLRGLSKKSTAFPYFGEPNGKEWYDHIIDGMKGLNNLNGQIGLSVSTFLQWQQGTFLPQIRRAMQFYVSPLKIYWNKLTQKKQKLKTTLRIVQKRFQKIKKNTHQMIKKQQYNGDLLMQQLQFVVLCKHFREDIRDWGRAVHAYCKMMQTNQNTLFNSLKRDIETFFIQIQKVHRGSQKHKQVKSYWENLRVEPQIAKGYAFDRLLSPQLLDFMQHHSRRQNNLQNQFVDFININKQDEVINRAQHFIDILSLRSFNCKISSNRADVFIYSDVDGNLLFVMSETLEPLYRMKLQLVSPRRVNQYSIQLNQIIPGIFVDSIRKEVLHFTTEDALEEFVHYVTSVPHQ